MQFHSQRLTYPKIPTGSDCTCSATLFVQLKQTGYHPVLCSNGLEGISYFRIHFQEVAAVLLDVIMPKMNGLECLREMKLINPNVKVIICSGYAGDESKETVLKEGVLAFLEKPFTFAEVAHCLQKTLQTMSAPEAVLI